MKHLKKITVLAITLIASLCMTPDLAFAAAVRTNQKSAPSVTIQAGETVTLKIKNNKKRTKWTIKSGRKYIRLFSKKKRSVKVKGIRKGTAKVQCKIGTKKLTYKVKVTVKNRNIPEPPKASITPSGTPGISTVPSALPTNAPLKDASGKNMSDVTTLKALIAEQISRGASLTEDINSDLYDWDENGNLVSINWRFKKLSGDISFAGLPSLVKLECGDNKLTNLDIHQNLMIRQLYCYDNPLTSLNVAGNQNLEILYADGTSITELDVTNNAKLKQLSCSYAKIQHLDISKNPLLEGLWLYRCGVTSITLTNNPNLTDIDLNENPLSAIDLNQNTKLQSLYLSGCTGFTGCKSQSKTGNPGLFKQSIDYIGYQSPSSSASFKLL